MITAQDTTSTAVSAAGFECGSAPSSPIGSTVTSLQEKCINYIRVLSAALPQKANSGHPGAPMSLALIAHCLYGRMMKSAPDFPEWIARDRFVLSNGHACALQYVMLHLLGFKVSMDDLKSFRQLDSLTPGHPERGHTPGVEVTTGPLGQGLAQGVGLAIAAEMMAARYNKPDIRLFNNHIFVVAGDGCMEEGVSSEAASLAGHLKLGRLIVLYDRNNISIDGDTNLSFSENVGQRFESYGWNVLTVDDAHSNLSGVSTALMTATNNLDRPTLIICNTIIGIGSQKQGTEKVHGSPLGLEDLMKVRAKLGIPSEDIFELPEDVLEVYRKKGREGNAMYNEWQKLLQSYTKQYPTEAEELLQRINNELPKNWMSVLPTYADDVKPNSTRALSGIALNAIAKTVPWLIGGSADLTTSNSCALKGEQSFQAGCRSGRYLHFGVREHAMAAVCNGIAAHGGFLIFGATFLNFIGYAWGAVRLSALSKLPVLYIATHDSIELGEDGATHQPIELAPLCRATPNLVYYRPADGNEVSAAYATWLSNNTRPVVLALCRNAIPKLKGTDVEKAMKGAYVIQDFKSNGKPGIIVASNGSELHICVAAAQMVEDKFDVRVVSMPCWELFLEQPIEYQRSVFPEDLAVKKLYVEAASTLGAERFCNATHGMTIFGASAPREKAWEKYGFTAANIADRMTKLVN